MKYYTFELKLTSGHGFTISTDAINTAQAIISVIASHMTLIESGFQSLKLKSVE